MGYNPIEVAVAASQPIELLRKSGQIGYTESGKVFELTADTKWLEKDTFGFAGKFTDEPLDLKRIICLTNSYTEVETGESVSMSAPQEAITIVADDPNCQWFKLGDQVLIASTYKDGVYGGTDLTRGMWFVGIPNLADSEYATDMKMVIEFVETIHPIDQKFLPPVDSITMNGADGKQYKLTVSGGALNIAEVV